MIFRSRVRKSAAWLAAVAMLFAQLAVAAHACAASSGASTAAVLATAHGDGSPCHEMDTQPDSVCLQHCADSPQSFDNHPVATVFPLAGLAYTLGRSDRVAVFLQSEERHSSALLARVTAPPLAVRNCCFRI